jgi:hypothetical protein
LLFFISVFMSAVIAPVRRPRSRTVCGFIGQFMALCPPLEPQRCSVQSSPRLHVFSLLEWRCLSSLSPARIGGLRSATCNALCCGGRVVCFSTILRLIAHPERPLASHPSGCARRTRRNGDGARTRERRFRLPRPAGNSSWRRMARADAAGPRRTASRRGAAAS